MPICVGPTDSCQDLFPVGYFLASPVQLSVSHRSLSKLCFWHLSSLIGVFFFLLLLVNEAYIPATLNLKLKYTILVLIGYLKIIHVRKLRFNVFISNNLN